MSKVEENTVLIDKSVLDDMVLKGKEQGFIEAMKQFPQDKELIRIKVRFKPIELYVYYTAMNQVLADGVEKRRAGLVAPFAGKVACLPEEKLLEYFEILDDEDLLV